MQKLIENTCIVAVIGSGVLLIASDINNIFPFLIGLGIGVVMTLWVQDNVS